jgi:type IV secretory pathway TrbF-like protein
LWLVTGDLEAAKRHVRRSVRRFVTKVRTIHKNKFIVRALAVIGASLARARVFLATRFKHSAAETSPGATFGPLY